jgi:hypothetical protein
MYETELVDSKKLLEIRILVVCIEFSVSKLE